jgi:hypothetical protein
LHLPAVVADLHVESWNELHEALFADSWREDISRHRSPFVFRGSKDRRSRLLTSLQNAGLERHEHHLLRHFRKYARRSDVPGDSVWNWLAVAKHHGLPTRILDWTYSPYVALHFATAKVSEFDRDGIVWCIDFEGAHRLLPSPIRQHLDEEEAKIFTAEMLGRIASSLKDFEECSQSDFVLFFEPPSLDDRIVNQFALFSISSRASLELDQFFAEHPEILKRVTFPAKLKWEVRDKLDQANVTERVLFPGLDGVADWLKRYYTVR